MPRGPLCSAGIGACEKQHSCEVQLALDHACQRLKSVTFLLNHQHKKILQNLVNPSDVKISAYHVTTEQGASTAGDNPITSSRSQNRDDSSVET